MHMRAFTTASIAAANSRGSKSAEDRPSGHKHRERARAAVIGLTHGVHESTGHSRGLALDLARTQLVSIHSVSLNSSRVLHGASGLTVGHNCRSDCEREREREREIKCGIARDSGIASRVRGFARTLSWPRPRSAKICAVCSICPRHSAVCLCGLISNIARVFVIA